MGCGSSAGGASAGDDAEVQKGAAVTVTTADGQDATVGATEAVAVDTGSGKEDVVQAAAEQPVQAAAEQPVRGDAAEADAEAAEVEEDATASVSLMSVDDLLADFQRLLSEKPFLNEENHGLNYYVKECRLRIAEGKEKDAQDAYASLRMELSTESRTIQLAFNRFDYSKDRFLARSEAANMLTYLGFPARVSDVEALYEQVDSNGDQQISLGEFIDHVGKQGGIARLYARRRQFIQEFAHGGTRSFDNKVEESSENQDTERFCLQECGLDDDAMLAWRLCAGERHLEAAVKLEACQKQALMHIRALARDNHERAFGKLQQRIYGLDMTDEDLEKMFTWIRELAPIVIHVNINKIGQYLENDTHYRNQFETATSGGKLSTDLRKKWEERLFGPAYTDAEPFDRPKYGVLSVFNDYRGVLGCKQYGDSYLVLNDARVRSTLSPKDSGNLPAKRLAVLDYYAHVMEEYSDRELVALRNVACGNPGGIEVGDSGAVIQKWGMYKEAQIHGPIDLDVSVSEIVVAPKHREDEETKALVERIAAKHNWTLTWMDDKRELLESVSTFQMVSDDALAALEAEFALGDEAAGEEM